MTFDPDCRRCPRLRRHLRDIGRQHPGYHAAPVGALGDAEAALLIIGLAPGLHGANRTGRPFTGDESGALLFRSLHALRLCDAPTSSGGDDTPRLRGCRITNAVKCLPPGNRPLADEIMRCNRYLSAEIAALPDDAVLLALGRVAHDAVLRALHVDAATRREMMFAHGAVHAISGLSGGSLWLVDSFHPSRYNVNTGRLSEQMFLRTLTEAARLCALV